MEGCAGRKTVLNRRRMTPGVACRDGRSLKRLEWYSELTAAQSTSSATRSLSTGTGWESAARPAWTAPWLTRASSSTSRPPTPLTPNCSSLGLGYDFQAAYYAKAAEANGRPFPFIFAVERKAPYSGPVRGYTRYDGRRYVQVREGPEDHAECEASGEWPNREPRILTLDTQVGTTVLVWKSPPNPRRTSMTSLSCPARYTTPAGVDTPDAEKQIVYMARVSNPSNQANTETSPRLIKYLIKHTLVTLEMASMQVEINTTRAVAAQVLRHFALPEEFSATAR